METAAAAAKERVSANGWDFYGVCDDDEITLVPDLAEDEEEDNKILGLGIHIIRNNHFFLLFVAFKMLL